MKRYEILEHLPPYGPMYVPISHDGHPFYSEGVAVRFYREDGSDWVANFQPGWMEFTQVLELEACPHVLVIARGSCYLINPELITPLSMFGVGYKKALPVDDGRWVLQDQVQLSVLEPEGSVWHSDRISWDGLAELTIDRHVVRGLAYNPTHDVDEWKSFTFDIDTRVLKGGSY